MTKHESLNLKEKDEIWYYCTRATDIQKCVIYNIVHSKNSKIIGKNLDLDFSITILEDNHNLIYFEFKQCLRFVLSVTVKNHERYRRMFENYAKYYPEYFI